MEHDRTENIKHRLSELAAYEVEWIAERHQVYTPSGRLVCLCTSDAIARFVANAPRDVRELFAELDRLGSGT